MVDNEFVHSQKAFGDSQAPVSFPIDVKDMLYQLVKPIIIIFNATIFVICLRTDAQDIAQKLYFMGTPLTIDEYYFFSRRFSRKAWNFFSISYRSL